MTAAEILSAFGKMSAVVIGDICLDRWCTYDPAYAEPSRETGIPRIAVVSTETTPGAGGTVANNLAALGAGRVAVLGATGADGFGHELLAALERRKISHELLLRYPAIPTFTYTKLLNRATGAEDQPRVDFINTSTIPDPIEQDVLANIRNYAGAFDVIFVSDQAETQRGGVVTAGVRNLLTDLALAHPQKVIWVDSRMRSDLFRHVILKSNCQEADAASNAAVGSVDYSLFRKAVSAPLLFVTQGARGATVVDEQRETFVACNPVDNPVDICGAGDSFSAAAGVALAITGSPVDAARFGNLIASITIMKKGTGTATPDEVLKAAAEAGW